MEYGYPLVNQFFELENSDKKILFHLPSSEIGMDKNLLPLIFPSSVSRTRSFLVIQNEASIYHYVIQTAERTYTLSSNYLHWRFFTNTLKRAIQCTDEQRHQFLNSLVNLFPPATLTYVSYPSLNFKEPMPRPLETPSSDELMVLLTLDTNVLITLLSTIYNERRIIVVGSSEKCVSVFIISLLQVLSPLSWKHTIIPLLPERFLELVQSPTPYIIGIPSELQDQLVLTDVIVMLDIDKGTIRSTDSLAVKSDCTLFPQKWVSQLVIRLEDIKQKAFDMPQQLNDAVLDAFKAFHNNYIPEIENRIQAMVETGEEFGLKEFLNNFFRYGDMHKFLEVFIHTTAFDQFVLYTEAKLKKRGIKKVKKGMLKSIFRTSSKPLFDVDDAVVMTSTHANPPVFSLL